MIIVIILVTNNCNGWHGCTLPALPLSCHPSLAIHKQYGQARLGCVPALESVIAFPIDPNLVLAWSISKNIICCDILTGEKVFSIEVKLDDVCSLKAPDIPQKISVKRHFLVGKQLYPRTDGHMYKADFWESRASVTAVHGNIKSMFKWLDSGQSSPLFHSICAWQFIPSKQLNGGSGWIVIQKLSTVCYHLLWLAYGLPVLCCFYCGRNCK